MGSGGSLVLILMLCLCGWPCRTHRCISLFCVLSYLVLMSLVNTSLKHSLCRGESHILDLVRKLKHSNLNVRHKHLI